MVITIFESAILILIFFFKFLIFFAWFLWLPWFPENYETYCICYLVWLIKVETIWFPSVNWSFWLEYILAKMCHVLYDSGSLVSSIQSIKREVIKTLKSIFRLQAAAAGSLISPWGNLWATLLLLHYLFQIAYEGDFRSLFTVTFWQKVDFLISNAR